MSSPLTSIKQLQEQLGCCMQLLQFSTEKQIYECYYGIPLAHVLPLDLSEIIVTYLDSSKFMNWKQELLNTVLDVVKPKPNDNVQKYLSNVYQSMLPIIHKGQEFSSVSMKELTREFQCAVQDKIQTTLVDTSEHVRQLLNMFQNNT